jgi:hypothetical protein
MGAFDNLRGDQISHGCKSLRQTSSTLFRHIFPLISSQLVQSRAALSCPPSFAPVHSLTSDWGHHTGTIDWCETNYSHSRYIAEFVNTLTNLPSISLGLYGLYQSRKNGIPLRYGLCFLGLSLIGVGSFGFHASLRWEWQLMDELPMVCPPIQAFVHSQ